MIDRKYLIWIVGMANGQEFKAHKMSVDAGGNLVLTNYVPVPTHYDGPSFLYDFVRTGPSVRAIEQTVLYVPKEHLRAALEQEPEFPSGRVQDAR